LADEPEVGDEGGGRGGNAGDDLYNDHEKGEGARGDEDAVRCEVNNEMKGANKEACWEGGPSVSKVGDWGLDVDIPAISISIPISILLPSPSARQYLINRSVASTSLAIDKVEILPTSSPPASTHRIAHVDNRRLRAACNLEIGEGTPHGPHLHGNRSFGRARTSACISFSLILYSPRDQAAASRCGVIVINPTRTMDALLRLPLNCTTYSDGP